MTVAILLIAAVSAALLYALHHSIGPDDDDRDY